MGSNEGAVGVIRWLYSLTYHAGLRWLIHLHATKNPPFSLANLNLVSHQAGEAMFVKQKPFFLFGSRLMFGYLAIIHVPATK